MLTVIGTRPEFIQAAPLLDEIGRRGHGRCLVHTGQHYSDGMSSVFFKELRLPMPDHHLDIGAQTQVKQIGWGMLDLEPILEAEKPDAVVVFGDTNSTLIGALCAVKMGFPLAHVEAGMRSFNRKMPEEHNRIVVDHLADFLFAPTHTAMDNLAEERVGGRWFWTGDIIMDRFAEAVSAAEEKSIALDRFALLPQNYNMLTLHRPSNVDDPVALDWILAEIELLETWTIFPVHPRTGKAFGFVPENVRAIEPLGYFDMLQLMRNASAILTDSGGVQKEAYLLGVPCVTLRAETEWPETTEAGWNVLCEPQEDSLAEAVTGFRFPNAKPDIFGKPGVSGRMLNILEGAL